MREAGPVSGFLRYSATGDGTANFSEAITGPDVTGIWLNPPHP